MIGFRVHIFDSKMPKPLQPFCPSALARPHLVQGFTLSCSTVGDVVQLVRTLPRRWLESHTVTAVLLLGVIINIYRPAKARSSPSRSPEAPFDLPEVIFSPTLKMTNPRSSNT